MLGLGDKPATSCSKDHSVAYRSTSLIKKHPPP